MRLQLAFLFLAAACAPSGARPQPVRPVAPSAPATGIRIAPGEDLQARIDAAEPGSTLILAEGEYRGPIVVSKRLALWGPQGAVIRARDEGSTVRLEGDGASLLGCTVDGSGRRFDLLDSAVHVRGADIKVEGVLVVDALFGILVEQSQRACIKGNCVRGSGQRALGLRGDAIRLWETVDSEVVGNRVTDSRDVVIWYSSRNKVKDNVVSRGRYGTHFMYSHECELEGNRYVDDVVGCFVMYCHDIRLTRNVMARAGGSAGIGIGVKESGNLIVEDNWLVGDTSGVYLDTSPLDLAHHNRFARNVFAMCETGVAFHSSPHRNEFTANSFHDDGAVIKVGGGGDAMGIDWHGNFFDVYRGYDLDGDGIGDVPFEFRRLSTQLEGRYESLALLHGAPAMQLVDLIGDLMPLFRPQPLMVDRAPLLRAEPTWQPQEVDDAR